MLPVSWKIQKACAEQRQGRLSLFFRSENACYSGLSVFEVVVWGKVTSNNELITILRVETEEQLTVYLTEFTLHLPKLKWSPIACDINDHCSHILQKIVLDWIVHVAVLFE